MAKDSFYFWCVVSDFAFWGIWVGAGVRGEAGAGRFTRYNADVHRVFWMGILSMQMVRL